ncbi:MAG: hypothetical protein ACYTG6_09575 [Planctomycetota bacterium]|jgi:hypothetical protein
MKHLLLALPLVFVASCGMLTPADEETGPKIVDPGTGEERAAVPADTIVDGAAAAIGAATGNPLLWGLLASAGHLVVGGLASRKKAA